MKRTFLAAIIVFISIALTGCGGGGSSAPATVFSTQILSDPAIDGDISVPVSGIPIIITQGNTQSVFAGIDPFNLTEFRAFLDFPLSGPGGVPANAVIVSATLDIFINNVTVLVPPADTVPIRIDLVSFLPPLIASDFDRTILTPLSTLSIGSIISADIGTHVLVDVTSLMVTAQNLGLSDFQVRILEDFGPVTPGLIEINDTTGVNRVDLAPLLRVDFL
jgi:hypothetical protein